MSKSRVFVVVVGLALGAVACGQKSEPGVSKEPLARANPASPTPSPAAPPRATPKTGEPPPQKALESAKGEPAKKLAKSAPASTGAALPEGLAVKRIVITRSIEKREPVAVERLIASDEPLYAFVEIANGDAEPGSVVITFEREGASVGHIKLEVPAKNGRWRTWGKTKQVRQAGDWVAIVKTADGQELGRKAFSVE